VITSKKRLQYKIIRIKGINVHQFTLASTH